MTVVGEEVRGFFLSPAWLSPLFGTVDPGGPVFFLQLYPLDYLLCE